jgi:hypothetical protein
LIGCPIEAFSSWKTLPTHSSIDVPSTAARRFRKLTRDQIAVGLCIPLKKADAVGVTQDYLAERDRPQNKVLFARDVLADLMVAGNSEGEPLDGALDSYAVTETSIQAVYVAKIGTSQERLAKVRCDYGIRQKAALDKLTPNLRRNVVKKVILIGLGLDFLLSTTSNNKFVGPHIFQPALWRELHDRYGDMPSSSEVDLALIVIPT